MTTILLILLYLLLIALVLAFFRGAQRLNGDEQALAGDLAAQCNRGERVLIERRDEASALPRE